MKGRGVIDSSCKNSFSHSVSILNPQAEQQDAIAIRDLLPFHDQDPLFAELLEDSFVVILAAFFGS